MDIMLYIQQVMKELGIEKYSIIPTYIEKTTTDHIIKAGNEYWFLNSDHAFTNLTILSENEFAVFNNYANYMNMKYARVRMFQGLIQITQAPNIKIEFLRVIPEYSSNSDQK